MVECFFKQRARLAPRPLHSLSVEQVPGYLVNVDFFLALALIYRAVWARLCITAE